MQTKTVTSNLSLPCQLLMHPSDFLESTWGLSVTDLYLAQSHFSDYLKWLSLVLRKKPANETVLKAYL